MEVIAHRGASGTEPENTLRSFVKAETFGADMIELDVRKTSDNEIVVIHDFDLLKLFGDPRKVSEITLAELKRVSGEHGKEVPTLREVVDTVHAGLVIEIKVHGIERQVLEIIKKFPNKVLISSFFPEILKKVRTLDGNIPLALIIPIKRFHMVAIANYLAKKLNLDSIHPRSVIVSAPIISLFRLSNCKVYAWTVNSESEYKRMKKLGVDGIITDYPELINEYVKSASL